MREIKFRAWDKGDKMMRYPTKLWFDFEEFIKYEDDDVMRFPSMIVLMQYTGLKDKNGKEIYEGDIVDFGRGKGDVYFDKGRFWVRDFFCQSFDEPSDAFGEGKGNLEVIGNIYESKHLLDNTDLKKL